MNERHNDYEGHVTEEIGETFEFIRPNEKEPGGLSRSLETLMKAIASNKAREKTLVGVGWHTESEIVLRRSSSDYTRIMWSHGVGCFTLYRSRWLLSILRAVGNMPEFLCMLITIWRCNAIVVAYKRICPWDTRSIDEAIARLMGKKVIVIPNAIDTDFWTPEKGELAVIKEQVLCIGRLEWQKGVEDAVRVLSRLPKEYTLRCLVPKPNKSYELKLRKMAKKLRCDDRLHIDYGLSDKQRRRHLRSSCCLLHMSEAEYQSLAILESLATGCPVVAYPRGWLINRSIAGVSLVRSIEEATASVKCVNAKERKIAERAKISRLTRSVHSLRAVSARWIHMFEQLR